MQQSNPRCPVRVILNRMNNRFNTVFIPSKIYQPKLLFMSAAAMPNRNETLVIPPVRSTLRKQQTLFRGDIFRNISEVADTHISPPGIVRFVFFYAHVIIQRTASNAANN
jgi:hypothetical protein